MKRDIKQAIKGLIIVSFNNAALFLLGVGPERFIVEADRDTLFSAYLLYACVWFFTVLIIIGSFLKSEDRNCKKEQKNEVDSALRVATVGTTASGKTAMLDIQSLVQEEENAGHKLKVFDIAELGTSWKGFSPFNDTYDILGEDRLSFIEQLSTISDFTIIEEDDVHTRIRFKKKNGYTEEELNKMYSDFIALKNSLKVQTRNVSTHVN